MRMQHVIVVCTLSVASFLMARQLHSENQVTIIETQKASKISAHSKSATDIILPFCSAASNTNPNIMPEKELRNYIVNCTKILLAEKDYQSLDALIGFLRHNEIRTPSGLWLQSFYYGGIEEFIKRANTDIELDAIELQFNQWQKISKNSDAARLAMSSLMIKRAWFYRGNEYASEVSGEAFEKFYSHVEKARLFLFDNEDISQRDPEWFTQAFSVLRVGRKVDEIQYQEYFDKAVMQYPEYYPMYFSAANFYLPKWHGNDDAFEKFAKSGDGILNPEQAKALYARIYWAHTCGKCGEVANWRDHWNDLRAGFEQIVRDYPDQWNINNYARIACTANDQDKTFELLQKIKGEHLSDAWNDEQFSYEYCANWSGFSKAER